MSLVPIDREAAAVRLPFVDTHTGGEPTRIVYDLPSSLPRQCVALRDCLRETRDDLRQAIVCEPRGSDVLVGALLTEPSSTASAAGVVFINNVGCLGMCGHGTAGLAVAMRHLGKIQEGRHTLDTIVGPVNFRLDGNRVTFTNVPCYRSRMQVPVQIDADTTVHGDIAYGGNWFFICQDHGQVLEKANVERLTLFTKRVRRELAAQGITGTGEAEIDHIELTGPPSDMAVAESRNFVLCPGGQYDRSPCGTGTSAKVACLAADGKLLVGQKYRQESIVGSVFEATYEIAPACDSQTGSPIVIPTITATAYVISQGELLLHPDDPMKMGLPN